MITEQHEYITSHFIDNDRQNVVVFWEDPDTGELVEEIVEVRDTDAAWMYLLQHTTIDDIHENTKIKMDEDRAGFIDSIKRIAAAEGLLVSEDDFNKQNSKAFLERVTKIFTNELTEEELFMLKLAVFEIPELKESEDRKKKSDLRKAKTGLDVMKATFAFMNDSAK